MVPRRQAVHEGVAPLHLPVRRVPGCVVEPHPIDTLCGDTPPVGTERDAVEANNTVLTRLDLKGFSSGAGVVKPHNRVESRGRDTGTVGAEHQRGFYLSLELEN